MGEKTDMDDDGDYNWKNNPMAMSGEYIVSYDANHYDISQYSRNVPICLEISGKLASGQRFFTLEDERLWQSPVLHLEHK